jgi:hypothetical protein
MPKRQPNQYQYFGSVNTDTANSTGNTQQQILEAQEKPLGLVG